MYKLIATLICLVLWTSLTYAEQESKSPNTTPLGPYNLDRDVYIVRYKEIFAPVVGKKGMVSTQNDIATSIGVNILKQGGNAVDASVAVGFALAVTLPRAGNIGGGGFMLIHMDGQTESLDYRETAPSGVSAKDFD